MEKYKPILMEKDYKQKARIDYDEVFAPIVGMEMIRLIIFFYHHRMVGKHFKWMSNHYFRMPFLMMRCILNYLEVYKKGA